MSASRDVSLTITGDELLGGFVSDAHVAFVARELRGRGIRLARVAMSGDDADQLGAELERARGDAVAIVTGGLGPTHDDRTAAGVAAACGRDLRIHAGAQDLVRVRVEQFVRARGGNLADYQDNIDRQALLPDGAEPLDPLGTAPGFWLEAGGTLWCVLPGPPAEMRHAWQQLVVDGAPLGRWIAGAAQLHERLLRVWGVPESQASRHLEQVGHEDSEACQVTLCARLGEIELSIRGRDRARVDTTARAVAARLGDAVWNDDDRSVAELVVAGLDAAGQSVATAESCTAGLVAARLSEVPGASQVLVGGIVAYQEHAKRDLLGVADATVREHTVVSEAVAEELAIGARERCGSDWGVGTTGWAGPAGGTPERPVGTVCVAVARPDGSVMSVCRRMPGPRGMVVARAVQLALHSLRVELATAGS